MNKIVAILCTLLLTCCVSVQLVSKPKIDPEFEPYVQQFVDYSRGVIDKDIDFQDITIRFDDLEGTVVGSCLPLPWMREIKIDRKWWNNNQSQLVREELMFHEFGHCILFRPHTIPKDVNDIETWLENILFKLKIIPKKDGFLKDGCPSSYMHPYTFSLHCIEKHYDYYMEELFVDFVVEETEEEITEEFFYKTL